MEDAITKTRKKAREKRKGKGGRNPMMVASRKRERRWKIKVEESKT